MPLLAKAHKTILRDAKVLLRPEERDAAYLWDMLNAAREAHMTVEGTASDTFSVRSAQRVRTGSGRRHCGEPRRLTLDAMENRVAYLGREPRR